MIGALPPSRARLLYTTAATVRSRLYIQHQAKPQKVVGVLVVLFFFLALILISGLIKDPDKDPAVPSSFRSAVFCCFHR